MRSSLCSQLLAHGMEHHNLVVHPGEEAAVGGSAGSGRGSAEGVAVGGCAERRQRSAVVRGGSTSREVREGEGA
jgi:hypothetical protein